MLNYDLVIIGGGSAGIASAMGAYDNGLRSILVLEKEAYLGGILNQCIHNGFGLHQFNEELSGPEYAERFANELVKRNIEYRLETMVLEIKKDLTIVCSSINGCEVIKAKAIICATGCTERTRGAIATQGDRPSGVMTAGLAQRYLNIEGYLVGKKVFILGSGDIGLIMARRMTLEGAKVLGVAELMPYSNGLSRNIVQCLQDFNIPLYLSHTVKRIIGKNRLEKIVICQVDNKNNFVLGTDKEFEVDTLLLSVGLIPNNPLLSNLGVKMHPRTKGPIVDDNYQTSIPGIFACGNGLHVHDLVDFVTNEGIYVGKKVAEFIKNGQLSNEKYVTIEAGNGIGYVLPSKFSVDKINAEVKFRVTSPHQKSHINIIHNGIVIKSVKKQYLLPAEMEDVKFDISKLESGNIVLEVVDD